MLGGLWTCDPGCRLWQGVSQWRLWTYEPRFRVCDEVTMETVDDSRYMAWVVGLPWTVDM